MTSISVKKKKHACVIEHTTKVGRKYESQGSLNGCVFRSTFTFLANKLSIIELYLSLPTISHIFTRTEISICFFFLLFEGTSYREKQRKLTCRYLRDILF